MVVHQLLLSVINLAHLHQQHVVYIIKAETVSMIGQEQRSKDKCSCHRRKFWEFASRRKLGWHSTTWCFWLKSWQQMTSMLNAYLYPNTCLSTLGYPIPKINTHSWTVSPGSAATHQRLLTHTHYWLATCTLVNSTQAMALSRSGQTKANELIGWYGSSRKINLQMQSQTQGHSNQENWSHKKRNLRWQLQPHWKFQSS